MPVLNIQKSDSLKKRLHRVFFKEKLNNPVGYVLGGILAVLLAGVLTILPLKLGLVAIGAVLSIPFVLYCFLNIHFGIITILTLGFFVSFIGKFVALPVGMAIDGILVLLIASLFFREKEEGALVFLKHPITYAVIAWMWYNCLLAINPWAQSYKAWFFTVRTFALYFSMYFVVAYAIKSMKDVKLLFKAIIVLSILSAVWALKQEFIGYLPAEMAWLRADPYRFQLNFQWGRIRTFSFFSDPTTFGILMATMGTFCAVLFLGVTKIWQKIVLSAAVVSMLLGIAFAGSRTPVAMIPAGVIFFMWLTFKKETIIGAALIFMLGGVVMMKSTSNLILYRLQSAFKPQDASYQLRLNDQDRIQPFIQSHPFGMGLGSTGMWGQRFNPDHFLAKFDHNSMYVRIAVEAGYVGLLIYCVLFFLILKCGIQYFLRCYDPTIKNYYLAITCWVFLLAIANYPQEAATIPPTSFVFYVFLGALVRMKDFDQKNT